jgi:dTDP-4-dehydrorhamnose 3,5-epimerase-like enzyme
VVSSKETRRFLTTTNRTLSGISQRSQRRPLLLIETQYFSDERGYVVETYSKRSARDLGVAACFVQDNQSLSLKCGTVRALHFRVPPKQ